MREFINIIESRWDSLHQDALDKTGFWGRAGAGCLVMSKNSGKFLIGLRSGGVEQPNTWGTFGGAIDPEDDIKSAAFREFQEETGFSGNAKLIPIYIFKDNKTDFRYYNFLTIVDFEFKPVLNWENNDSAWVEWGDWPAPLHFGLKAILADAQSVTIIHDKIKEFKNSVDKNFDAE